jgi:hypothetical protein
MKLNPGRFLDWLNEVVTTEIARNGEPENRAGFWLAKEDDPWLKCSARFPKG